MPRSARVQLAIDLWLVYRDQGRTVPPTWAARAAGASPTAVLTALRASGLLHDTRRGHDGRDWNWARRVRRCTMPSMNNASTLYIMSNGHRFEVGGDEDEVPPAAPAKVLDSTDEGLLDFGAAMACVAEGWAVARMVDCSRVVYVADGAEGLLVGRSDRGVCSDGVPYQPTLADLTTSDWMMIGAEAQPETLQAGQT